MTRTPSVPTTAALHGPRWSARAGDWATLAAKFSAPAWEAVADATGVGAGTRVLDVGCGSGEFCRLAAARAALVSGIDAAQGMIAVARRRVPAGDLRVGAIEDLPWADDSFDVVTAFNSVQFAADRVVTLAEAKRVARLGGQIAVCNWARPDESQLSVIMNSVRELQPPPAPGERRPDAPPMGQPGVLEDLARRVGIEPVQAAEVDVPVEAPDRETLERALLAPGAIAPAIAHSGEAAVRKAIAEAAAPFRRPDGSYRIENQFRYVICTV